MDQKELLELMDYLATSDFVEFELERGGFKLRLLKAARQVVVAAPLPLAPSNLDAQSGTPVVATQVAGGTAATEPAEDLEAITSPMVGTFYRSPNPKSEPFVDVGDTVEVGQIIGIVEAMKLMNEIEADRSGEIVEIPVANGQPVEYGETLFRIRPVA